MPKDSLPNPDLGRPGDPALLTADELERLLRESGEAVAEWEAEHGAIPEDVLAEVDAKLMNARPVR
jgi:hypothetical protein